jgi:UDP-N-acetylglucosamine 4,6-dehydratase
VRFIKSKGFQPFECATEEDARELVATLPENGKWPYILTKSDTTGEKPHEEFFTATEVLDLDKFWNLGIIKSNWEYDRIALTNFEDSINLMKSNRSWTKSDIVDEFKKLIPEFSYYDHGKYLSGKM